MKRLLVPILLFLLLISCSSEDLKGRIVEGETSISVDAEYFQGERTYTLDFDEDREVKLDLETLSGKIYIKVQDSGGKVVLEGSYGSLFRKGETGLELANECQDSLEAFIEIPFLILQYLFNCNKKKGREQWGKHPLLLFRYGKG